MNAHLHPREKKKKCLIENRYISNTYTKDGDRQSACACAVLRARDREQPCRPTLERRDPTLVALPVGIVAVELRNEDKMFSHSRRVEANTTCKLQFKNKKVNS